MTSTSVPSTTDLDQLKREAISYFLPDNPSNIQFSPTTGKRLHIIILIYHICIQ